MLNETNTAQASADKTANKRVRTSRALEQNGVRMVIGASRGIVLALVKAQLHDPSVNCVIATCRP
jgi:hypothetical protein